MLDEDLGCRQATNLPPALDAGWAILVHPERQGPMLFLQRVPEPKVGKHRVHLDLHVPDAGAAIAEYIALGVTRLRDVSEPYGPGSDAIRWTVMAGPEGNEFCVAAD